MPLVACNLKWVELFVRTIMTALEPTIKTWGFSLREFLVWFILLELNERRGVLSF